MASAAQRAWVSRAREAAGLPAAPIPSSLRRSAVDVVRSAQEAAASEGREYRGPTVTEAAAGRLTSFKSSTHRKSARTTALTQSGIKAGQTEPEAYVQATKTVYGAKSPEAEQAVLIKRVYDAKRKAVSEGRIYKGPTYTQAAQGELLSTVTRKHKDSARVEALIRSGMRAGQTRAEAAAEATKRVFGINSTQARQSQLTRNKELERIRNEKKKAAEPPKVTTTDLFPSMYTGARYGGKEISFSDIMKSGNWKIVKYEVEPLAKTIKEQNLQLTSMSSKIQTHTAQLNIYENRLDKYNIVNGKFVGTEKQYDQYKKDYQKYVDKMDQVNTEVDSYNNKLEDYESNRTTLAGLELKAERAKYGGLAGKYADIERKTSAQLKAEKAEFKEKHPQTVKQFENLYGFIKKTSELQVVGPTPSGFGTVTKAADPMVTGLQLDEQSIDAVVTLSKREGFKGIVQQAGQKPVKTAAMVGVGIVTPPVIKGVSTVGKALGAGRKVSIAGKRVLYGMGGMYVVGTGIKYTQAGTPYERGAVLGEAIFQEIVPLFVGGYIGTKGFTAALSKVPKPYQSYYKKYPKLLEARNKLTLEKDKKIFDAYVKATEAADIPIKPKGELNLRNVKYIPKKSAPKIQAFIKKTKGSLVYGSSVSRVYFKGARRAADIDIGIRGNTKTFAEKVMKIMIATGGVKPQNVRVTYNKKFNSASVDIKANGVKWSESAKVHHAVDVHSRSTMEGLLEHGVPTRPPKKIKGQEILDPGEQLTRKSIDSILQIKKTNGKVMFGAAEHRATKDLDDFIYMASEMQRQGMMKAEGSLLFRGVKVGRMQDIGDSITIIRGGKPLPRSKPYTYTTFFKMFADTKAEVSALGKTSKRSKPLIQKETKTPVAKKPPYKPTTTPVPKKKAGYTPVTRKTPTKPRLVTPYKPSKTPSKKKAGYTPVTRKTPTKPRLVTPYKPSKTPSRKRTGYTPVTRKTPTKTPLVTPYIQKRSTKGITKPKEFVEPVFPPLLPSMKIPTKKKTIKKRVGVITLNQKNLNAVATFRQVLGGL